MIRSHLTRLLASPLARGWTGLACAAAAVALPTGFRAAIDGAVTGCEFTPYLPFVLLAAVLIGWWQAGAVALLSVAILGGLFGAAGPMFDMPCFISAAATFAGASAVIIAFVMIVRRVLAGAAMHGSDDETGGVVLSLEQGDVWASWYGQGRPVRLGSQRKVTEMLGRLPRHGPRHPND